MYFFFGLPLLEHSRADDTTPKHDRWPSSRLKLIINPVISGITSHDVSFVVTFSSFSVLKWSMRPRVRAFL